MLWCQDVQNIGLSYVHHMITIAYMPARRRQTGRRTNIVDYRKAFDSVPHKRLIEKLKGYGLYSKVITWIENFLQKRQIESWSQRKFF